MSLVETWGKYFAFVIFTEKTRRIMTSSHASVTPRDCVIACEGRYTPYAFLPSTENTDVTSTGIRCPCY